MALMGQSCGGVQVLDFAVREPGISSLVVLNSGTFPDDRALGGSTLKGADLARLTVPTLILVGGKDDIAYANGQGDYDRLTAAPSFIGSANYGHRATYFEKDGGLFGRVALDWLRWTLKADDGAGRRFRGSDCGLCTDGEWTVRRRLLDRVGAGAR